MTFSRRAFIKKTAIFSGTLPFLNMPLLLGGVSQNSKDLEISIFSKHLQFLDYKEMGEVAAELGFDGIDLTVRPKGHVLPRKVKTDLPKAIRAINDSGSSCKLITTNIKDSSNSNDLGVIETAGKYGIKYYRSDWIKYLSDQSMTASLKVYQEQIRKLGILNKEHKVIGCYQNHAGTKIGASFWEIKMLLETVDPAFFGAQFDIRHAVVEGAFSWENGLKLLKDHIKVIVLKDFKWAKVKGKWKIINVPIGEGMVDFSKYFSLLKHYGLNPPVSLHLEYPLGGAEHGDYTINLDKKVVFDAMKKDLKTIRHLWKTA